MRSDPELQAYAARLEVKNGELQRRLDALMGSGEATTTSSSSGSSTRAREQQAHQPTSGAPASGSKSGAPKAGSGDQSRRSSWTAASPLFGLHSTPAISPAQLREPVDIGVHNLAAQLAEVVVGGRSRGGDRAHPLLALVSLADC